MSERETIPGDSVDPIFSRDAPRLVDCDENYEDELHELALAQSAEPLRPAQPGLGSAWIINPVRWAS